MAGIVKREQYERELIQIIDEKSEYFGQRGTHSQGIDVLLFKSSGLNKTALCVRGEVKTSSDHKIFFSNKLREQYGRYMELWNERRIFTYYFFRLLTSKQNYQYKINRKEVNIKIFRSGQKEDKWRVFPIHKLPLTRNGQPYLDFFNENAMDIDEFLEDLERP